MKPTRTDAPPSRAFMPLRPLAAIIGAVLMLGLGAWLWRVGAAPFGVFAIPLLLAACLIALWMAIYWREWRALPVSVVFAIVLGHQAMDLGFRAGWWSRPTPLELAAEVSLWLSVPLSLAAVAGLWRIFENQARYQKAQAESLEHERRYHHLVDNATDAFYTADEEGRFTLVNMGAARLFERRAQDLIGMSFYDLVPPETQRAVREALEGQRRRDARAHYHEFALTRRDGSVRWVGQSLQALLDGNRIRGFQAVLRDITERRTAQIALEQSESRLRSLFDTMSEGVMQIRQDGRIVFANPAAERILGQPRQEIESLHYADPGWEFLQADGSPMSIEQWAGFRAFREKTLVGNAVTGIRRKDGRISWINANAVPILKSNGAVDGVVVTFSDITQTKAAEENIRIVEFALDSAMEHVFLADADGRIMYANQRALRSLGYSAAEIREKTVFDIDRGISPADWAETWRRAKAGEWPTFESQHADKQGRVFPTLTSASYFEFNRREYLFAFVHDISRETELAAQLRQAQKMEAIGTLAGGIAHDFNNILSGVLGYAQLAMQENPEGTRTRMCLDEILKAGRRAADLVRQILTFSRKSDQKQQPLLLAPILKEALKLMRGSLPATIAIRDNIDTTAGPVMADPGQIHQVIVNLCTNAFHAMRSTGGTLTVVLKEVRLAADRTAAALNLPAGGYVLLSVSDTGHGMDEATRRRVFEPFFTTKPAGEGTGLGLATVHGIVKTHKGAIRVESEVGKGSTFEVYFPLCAAAAPPLLATPSVSDSLPRGNETILLVDDEQPIVRSTQMALEGLGYSVRTAATAVEALAMFDAAPGQFHLVITDQTMPQMTGFEFARRLLRAHPGLPVILCTGFSEAITREDAMGAGIRAVMSKPIEFPELARTVRSALDRK